MAKRKTSYQRGLTELYMLRLLNSDNENIEFIAHRLDMHKAEVTRRALRIGLQVLAETDIPGSTSPRFTEEASSQR